MPRENAVTDCWWAPRRLQSPLQGFVYFIPAWFEGACSGVDMCPGPSAAFSFVWQMFHTLGTAQWLHCTAGCFSCPKVPLKGLHSSPFSHSQGYACNSHNVFMCLMAMGSLKGPPVSSKQRYVGIKKGQSSHIRRYSSFTAALSLPCPCRFWIYLTSPCSFREPMLCAKPTWRVSDSSCQDSSPWKLFLFFISQEKYNAVLFYWKDTDTAWNSVP